VEREININFLSKPHLWSTRIIILCGQKKLRGIWVFFLVWWFIYDIEENEPKIIKGYSLFYLLVNLF
jgi:hypothetical protein